MWRNPKENSHQICIKSSRVCKDRLRTTELFPRQAENTHYELVGIMLSTPGSGKCRRADESCARRFRLRAGLLVQQHRRAGTPSTSSTSKAARPRCTVSEWQILPLCQDRLRTVVFWEKVSVVGGGCGGGYAMTGRADEHLARALGVRENAFLEPISIRKRSLYQHRLVTNIGKTQNKSGVSAGVCSTLP